MNYGEVLASLIEDSDEDLIDTLIAISVVAKRLANKLRQAQENWRNTYMTNKEEIKEILDITIAKAESYKARANDFIETLDILVIAAQSFIKVLEKRGSQSE